MVNLDNVSFIHDTNGKKAVILSVDAYEEIKEKLEELEDIKAYAEVKSLSQEKFPMALVEQLIESGESKIKIFREYRGYSVTALAKTLNISEAYLSQIENHKRKGNIDLHKKIANVLKVDIELLI